MSDSSTGAGAPFHNHVFLGEQHHKGERKTWAVIVLCTVMMIAEIGGGWLFGSIALISAIIMTVQSTITAQVFRSPL